jgi:hypothetical protein
MRSSMPDIVQHCLFWNEILEFLSTKNLSGTIPTRIVQILKECSERCPDYKPFIIPFNEWKDKFEGATTKKNRSSVHATTATFAQEKGSEFTSTLAIGVGSRDSRQNELDELYIQNDVGLIESY